MDSSREWKETLVSFQESNPEDVEKLLSTLKLLVKLSLEFENRKDVSERDVYHIISILEVHYPIHTNSHPQDTYTVCEEAAKLLRNLCAGLPGNQECLANHPTLLPQLGDLLKGLAGSETGAPSSSSLSRVVLQLLANLCVGQPSGQEAVWGVCYPQVFRELLQQQQGQPGTTGRHDDLACMLLHYCVLDNASHRAQLCADEASDIMGSVVASLATSPQAWEWSSLLLHSLLPCVPLRNLHTYIDHTHMTKERLSLLNFVLMNSDPNPSKPTPLATPSQPATPTQQTTPTLDANNANFLLELFDQFTCLVLKCEQEGVASLIRVAHAAPRPSEENLRSHDQREGRGYVPEVYPLDHVEVRTCHASLKLLCHYATDRSQLSLMQTTPTLLGNLLELLRELCTLDESANSSQNRTHLRSGLPRGEEEAWHPLYGFKRDVIRLLGNLLYRCGRVQDKVRERGGVSLILNQCGIDHRNPFIAQWSVFAIRNLCEDNPANQQLIAGLKARGVCPLDAEALEASGGEVEVGEDGRVRVKPKRN